MNTHSTGWALRRLPAALAGAAALALVAAGCSNNSPAAGNGDGNTAGADVDFASYIGKLDPVICAGREYTIGYDTFSDTDSFAVQLWKGMEEAAGELGCVKINKLVDNAKPDQAVQNANIFAQQHVDGAILFNVVQAASQGQSQVLKAADIPLVSLAVPVEGHPFITNDDEANGTQAGDALAQAYLDRGKTGDVYAILGRYDGQDSTKARMDGAEAGLKAKLPDVRILSVDTKADGPTAQAATAAVLPQIPAGATILLTGVNDDVTSAQLQAIKQAGRSADAMVMGIGGAYPVGLQYICKNPEYVGTVGFFPENWPKYLLPALIAEINGANVKTYPDKYVVKTEVITRDNIAQYYPDFSC